MKWDGNMKKYSFNLFQKVLRIFSSILLLSILIIMDVTVKHKLGFVDIFFYVWFLSFIPFSINEQTYYHNKKIIDNPTIFKRIRDISQIHIIEKNKGKEIFIHYYPDKNKKPIYSGTTVLKYSFQTESLIKVLEEILKHNPEIKFIENNSIIPFEEFLQKL
jgi:hypothetical protein